MKSDWEGPGWRWYNMSSAQGQRFAEVAREMTEKIRAGPSPVKKKSKLRLKGSSVTGG